MISCTASNLLVICTGEHHARRLGYCGHRVHTPNLDSLVCKGTGFSLLERSINPCDAAVENYAMYRLAITVQKLTTNRWHEAEFRWKSVLDREGYGCQGWIDGTLPPGIPLCGVNVNGIGCFHSTSSERYT